MHRKPVDGYYSDDLFRFRLDQMVNMRHELVLILPTNDGCPVKCRAELDNIVKRAFKMRKGRPVSPRLVYALTDARYKHDRKTIAKSMQ